MCIRDSRYGVWTHLKYECLKAFKSGRLQGEILKSWLASDSIAKWPSKQFGDSGYYDDIEGATPALAALNEKVDVLAKQNATLVKALEKQQSYLSLLPSFLASGGTLPAPRIDPASTPVMSSFNLDDFLEPISSPSRSSGDRPPGDRPADRPGQQQALSQFFCGTTGDAKH